METFVMPSWKEKKIKDIIIYELQNYHSKLCIILIVNSIKNNSSIIANYKLFIEKCSIYMEQSEIYNKKEFNIALQNIYNKNK